jgi:hypothetical protein
MDAVMKTTYKNIETEKRMSPRNDYSVPFNYKTSGNEFIGFMKNMSLGGALFDTSASLDINQEVELNIISPHHGGFSRLRGDVIRLDPNGYGIKFKALHHKSTS